MEALWGKGGGACAVNAPAQALLKTEDLKLCDRCYQNAIGILTAVAWQSLPKS